MGKFLLKLFITGQTLRSERAVTNLRRISEEGLGGEYELVIIDVLEQPHLAEQEKILATPTMIKVSPPPTRRIIGDFSDARKVLLELDVNPDSIAQEHEGEDA